MAVAGVVRIVPFGPASDGMRVSIWLAPIFVVGAASGLERIRSRLASGKLRVAMDVSAIVCAAVLVLSAIVSAPSYVTSGSGSAAAFVDRELGATDVVLIEGSVFPYSVATRRPTGVVPVHVIIAFVPSINDPRFDYASYDEAKGGLVLSPHEIHVRIRRWRERRSERGTCSSTTRVPDGTDRPAPENLPSPSTGTASPSTSDSGSERPHTSLAGPRPTVSRQRRR